MCGRVYVCVGVYGECSVGCVSVGGCTYVCLCVCL